MTDEQQITPEQIEELRTKAQEAEQLKVELEKLKSKDMNFENLRKAKEEEERRAKEANDKRTEVEKKVDEKLSSMERQQKEWRESLVKEKKELYVKDLCGDDQELRKKIEYEMTQLVGDEDTDERIKNKLERAYTLVIGSKPIASAFGRLSASPSAPYKPEAKRFTDGEDGQGVLKKFNKNVDWSKVKTGGSYFDNL